MTNIFIFLILKKIKTQNFNNSKSNNIEEINIKKLIKNK